MILQKRFISLACGILLFAGASVVSGCSNPQAKARREYEQQITERRQNEQASQSRYELAMDDYRADDNDAASEGFREAIEFSDRNVAAWNALGVVSFHQRDFVTATRAFQRASRLAPGAYEPHYNLGLVFETMGRFAEAIQTYESGLKLAPDALELKENLARTYIRADLQPQRAEELIQEALKWENRPDWRRWLELQSIRLRHHLGTAGLMAPEIPVERSP